MSRAKTQTATKHRVASTTIRSNSHAPAPSADATDVVEGLLQELRAGVPMSKAVAARHQAMAANPELSALVLRVLRLCRDTGASPIVAIERLLIVRAQSEEFESELEAEWATPRATVRLVVWLPIGFMALAQLLGLPILQAITGNALAKIAVAAGVLLLFGARSWSKRILLRSQPIKNSLADEIDLVSIALSAGLSFDRALQRSQSSPEVGVFLEQERILARSTGAPIAKLALTRADKLRVHAHRASRLRIKEAAVSLMWPLGVAVLPALILLLVIPLSVGFATPVAT